MVGPRTKSPGILRRTDVAVTAKVPCLDVDVDMVRGIALAPEPAVARWIMDELGARETEIRYVASGTQVVNALIGCPPPHPPLRIVDFDPLGPADVFALHELRARGWFGAVIGLGSVAHELRSSLAVARVLARPLDAGSLARAVDELGLCNPTMPIAIMRGNHLR